MDGIFAVNASHVDCECLSFLLTKYVPCILIFVETVCPSPVRFSNHFPANTVGFGIANLQLLELCLHAAGKLMDL